MSWVLSRIELEWKMISGAPIHFAVSVFAFIALSSWIIWKVLNWRWGGIVENNKSRAELVTDRHKAEIAELNFQLNALRQQMKLGETIDEKPIPEIYNELTPSGGRQWTRGEISKLSDGEKANLKKRKPGLWRWYARETQRPLTYDEIMDSEEDFRLP